jgi:hypothetical protein
VPLVLKPVIVPAEAEAVQLNVVPAILAVGVNDAVLPEHIVCVKLALVIVGNGLTVTTKLVGVALAQDAGAGLVGVITYVTVPAAVPELLITSEILPVPLVLNPVTVPTDAEAVQL